MTTKTRMKNASNAVKVVEGASRMYVPFDAAGIAIQIGHTPLLRAYFGRAKTFLGNSLARALGRKMFCLVGSMTDPLDLKGLPYITDNEVRYAPEAMFKYAMEHDGNVIIFADEITTFPGAVKATLLKMIHEKIVGPHTLPSNTRFLAACNAAIDAPNGRPLDAGNINRMCVLDLAPLDRDDVARWNRFNVIGFDQAPAPEWTIVPENWRATHRAEVASYIEAWADVGDNWKAWDERAKNDARGDYAPFGSLRSWEATTDLMAAARASGLDYESETMSLLVRGCIGESNAVALLTEMKLCARVPSAEQLFMGERDLPSGMFETRLAASRIYSYVRDHADESVAKRGTALMIAAAEGAGAGVCRTPLGQLFRLFNERKAHSKPYFEEIATVIATNRIRLGVD